MQIESFDLKRTKYKKNLINLVFLQLKLKRKYHIFLHKLDTKQITVDNSV